MSGLEAAVHLASLQPTIICLRLERLSGFLFEIRNMQTSMFADLLSSCLNPTVFWPINLDFEEMNLMNFKVRSRGNINGRNSLLLKSTTPPSSAYEEYCRENTIFFEVSSSESVGPNKSMVESIQRFSDSLFLNLLARCPVPVLPFLHATQSDQA
ncbi:hypothetical protein Tco_1294991 [Tanacetum coccineum]